MKNNFQSNGKGRNQRVWQLLISMLFFLFSLGIGNVWGTDYSVVADWRTEGTGALTPTIGTTSDVVTFSPISKGSALSSVTVTSGTKSLVGIFINTNYGGSNKGGDFIDIRVPEGYTIKKIDSMYVSHSGTFSGKKGVYMVYAASQLLALDAKSSSPGSENTYDIPNVNPSYSTFHNGGFTPTAPAGKTSDSIRCVRIYKKASSGQSHYIQRIKVTVSTVAPPCNAPSITTQPTGASIGVGYANPTLSVIANNTTSYTWKESSDGTSYDGSSSLASTASFTPEVNDAAQTKYYYCELVNSCNTSNIVRTNIVTVSVAASVVHVSSVSLDKTAATLTMDLAETVTLTPTVLPNDATNKNVSWSTSDGTVATVTNGVVTAKKAGTATITVTTEDGSKTATCAITVNASPCFAWGYGTTNTTAPSSGNSVTIGSKLTIANVGSSTSNEAPFDGATTVGSIATNGSSKYLTGTLGGDIIESVTFSVYTSNADNKTYQIAFASSAEYNTANLITLPNGYTSYTYTDAPAKTGERKTVVVAAPAGAKSFAISRNLASVTYDSNISLQNSGNRNIYYIQACPHVCDGTAATKYNVTGTTSICEGGNADVTLTNSQSGAKYVLLKDAAEVDGSEKNGTGSALVWNVSETGTYTVKAIEYGDYCETAMNGSAVISEGAKATIATAAQTIYVGGPTLTMELAEAAEGTWESSDPAKANITNAGVVTAVVAGATDITFTKTGGCPSAAVTITVATPYQVSFDANGGDPVSPQYATPSVMLPNATNGTASLIGWFDAAEGGNKIGNAGASYTPTANITLHAQWETVSSDNTLSDLKVGGVTVDGFDPAVNTYYVVLPYGTAVGDIPAISATANSPKAKQVAIQQAVWTGDPYNCYRAQANVQAEDESWGYYDVRFSFAPKDPVCLIKATVTGDNALAIDAPASLFEGTESIYQVYGNAETYETKTAPKFQSNGYLGVTLTTAGATFKQGDVVRVFATKGIDNAAKLYVYSDNTGTAAKQIAESETALIKGYNEAALTAAGADATSVFLCRAGQYTSWNPCIYDIAVYRTTNPMLINMTIDGRTVTINEAAKTATVTVPYEADLAALTITKTIVRNAPHATTPEAVISNAGAWVIGDNTYRVMDKDGDYTDYTITVARDVLKHTVSFNTHDGSAVASEEVEHNGYLAAAPAAPTKEDCTFRYWSLTDGGAEVDVTTVQITEDKTFHAVWHELPVYKLIINGAGETKVINSEYFTTGATMSTSKVVIGTDQYDYAKLGGTASDLSQGESGKYIAYNAQSTKTRIKITAYNNATSKRNIYVHTLAEGADAGNIKVQDNELAKQEIFNGEYVSEGTTNRTIYLSVPSSVSDVYFIQVKAIEEGETQLKRAGEVGYSLNLDKGRMFGTSNVEMGFEGINYTTSSKYTTLSSTALTTKSNVSFTVAAANTLLVLSSTGGNYHVTNNLSEKGVAYTAGADKEYLLNATGTWYIVPETSTALNISAIAFTLPKAEAPTITTQPATCHTFAPGSMTATVVAEVSDGGTLSYQWYNASDDSEVDGATTATLTTTTEGTYYVVVTNTLAGHQDVSVTSEEAELGYRVTNDATLSALSASNGTLDPAFDKDEENYRIDLAKGTTVVPTLSATATMNGYANVAINDAAEFVNYEAVSTVVVTSEDLTVTKTYTVHYYVAHQITTLVDVTENTTWDWSLVTKDANNADITSSGVIVNESESGLIIASYLMGDNFDKIEGNNGAYAIRNGSDKKVYQGASLHMHTTVSGYLSIWAANEGHSMTLNVVNEGRDMQIAQLTGSQVEYKVYVKAGDVRIYNVSSDSKPMRVSKITFTVDNTPDYTRNEMLGNGVYGTICLPYNVPAGGVFGVTIYELMGREPQYGKLAFDEIVSGEMEAGVPYVFQAHGDILQIFYGETHVDDPVDKDNGMYGTFVDQTLTELDDVYYFAQRALWSCDDLTSLNLPANRAYVKLSEINYLTDPNPAPGRRRITMEVNGEKVATDINNVQSDDVQCTKVMIDGQMYILRGEKMYDATGRLVK